VRADAGVRVTPRLVAGLGVIGLGMLFLYHELTGYDIDRVLRYWPVALILFGGTMVWNGGRQGRPSGQRQTRFWGLFWIAVGSWFLLEALDVVRYDPWDLFWPVLVLAIGASIVWRSLRGPRPAREGAPDLAQTFSAFALMSGVGLRNASQDFRGGEATAIMGGCEIDLRDARVAGGDAVVDAFALWGGVELKVPEGWQVVSEVLPIMGAFEDKTRPARSGESVESPRPRLVIKGFAIMGGIEVANP
jgi:cell wall-active antibiotic response 4TMS protein YvqF